MGRRALPKIDPPAELNAWLLEEHELPETLSSQSMFGRAAPLEIEVGTGKGLFLSQATAIRPEQIFVGIEVAGRYARFAAARLAELARRNGKLIHGDAISIFAERIRDDSIAAVHVYFPDPWWKTRHRKRRIMNPGFVRDIERVLQPSGQLHFWTDVKNYYQATIELIAKTTSLLGPDTPQELPADRDMGYRTHFERRTRLHDQPVFRTLFTKP